MTCVIDASAILAILFGEPGSNVALRDSRGGALSAVNLVEVLEKFARMFGDSTMVAGFLERLEVTIAPYTAAQAELAAGLKQRPEFRNVSLADRSCLALAIDRRLPVLTADSKWSQLGLDIDVRQIR